MTEQHTEATNVTDITEVIAYMRHTVPAPIVTDYMKADHDKNTSPTADKNTRPDSHLTVRDLLASQADGDLAGFYDIIRRYTDDGGDPDNLILDLAVMVNAADHTCSICELTPDQSGAQYGLAEVIWEGTRVNVCSNCLHGNPVSIVEIDKAASRAHLAANPDAAKTATAGAGWNTEPVL